jgi:hypothetical protein
MFLPTPEGEVRLLLLIDAFSGGHQSLEGRTKLAKLDFFLRYPAFLSRPIEIQTGGAERLEVPDTDNIETRMVRYRYGPWDPAYFALIGRLVGRGLVQIVHTSTGLGLKTSTQGHILAAEVAKTESWTEIAGHTRLLKRHLNKSGNWLKNFVYEHFPEVADASWGTRL